MLAVALASPRRRTLQDGPSEDRPGRKAGGEGAALMEGQESYVVADKPRSDGKKTSVRKRHVAQPRRDSEEGHGASDQKEQAQNKEGRGQREGLAEVPTLC